MPDNRFSHSFSLIVRRSKLFERLQRDEAADDIERHARCFEVRFSSANIVEQARKSPGARTENRCMLGEQLLRDDLSCIQGQPWLKRVLVVFGKIVPQ